MSYKKIKETRRYIKIKDFNNVVILEADLKNLGALIQGITSAICSGQIEIGEKEVMVKQWQPPKMITPLKPPKISKKANQQTKE